MRNSNHKIINRLKHLSTLLESYGESSSVDLLILAFSKEFENLGRGSRGPRVKEAQQALIDKGYELPRYGVDGIFGAETEAAVKKFQSENDLVPDGIIGKLTIAKLSPRVAIPTVTEEKPKVSYSAQRFLPFSERAQKLFEEASRLAEVPADWASSRGLHEILKRESDGWVGIPNYTYGNRSKDPNSWGEIHEELREGKQTTRSSATGLGQLLLKNVDKYYPSGRNGIGNPLEEAAGMLSYIKDRYQSPDKAWSMYGPSVEKVDPETGSVFTEGY